MKKSTKIEAEFVNREISWLSFNSRVLQEAADPTVPLVERLRFLGIFSNNLDEFFKVRVATHRRMLILGKRAKNVLSLPPRKLLKQIQEIVVSQQKQFEAIYQNIVRALEKRNIFFLDEHSLNARQKEFVTRYFQEHVHPAIVPIMIKYAPKFPYLNDHSLYLAVKLSRSGNQKKIQYALIEIPTKTLPRFIFLPGSETRKYIILLDDVIRFCLKDIFSVFNYDCLEAYAVKFTRDAKLDIDNDVSKSLLEKITKSLKDRERGDPLRFVSDSSIPDDLAEFLVNRLELSERSNLISGGRYHNFKDFMFFPNMGGRNLEYPPAAPLPHKMLASTSSIFALLRKQDILLHYPYQSFSHIIDLLREAAIDPKVSAIKIALYRMAPNSRIINALISAAKNGKDVLAIVELHARFDEEANIKWSNLMQEEGIRVIFGVPGLKVHCKLLLITRNEKGDQVHYANVGTGNFNESTAKVFSDTALLTSDPRITTDVFRVFNFIENTYKSPNYKHLIVSPMHMRKKMVRLINREIKNAKAGRQAYIFLKMNSLVDEKMIIKLYQASMAGVRIRLIIRGICSLVPGITGLSDNIQAVSIVDRYLEHSRIFVFCNDGNELYYISSADWMTRNLDHRVEVTCPITDCNLQKELKTFLEIQWRDNVKARFHDASMKNTYRKTRSVKKIRSQFALYDHFNK